MNVLLKNCLSFILLSVFFSCSVNAPIIRESDWSITIVDDREKDIVYEKLSIFLNCYDEDGENDIDTIFFIDDKNGIYWELNSDNWDYIYRDDVKWLGSKTIVMPDRSAIPRVPLRTFVRDLAGESVEDKVFITSKSYNLEELDMPKLKDSGNKYSITNYTKGVLELMVDNQVVAKGDIGDAPNSFEDIFGEEREGFSDDLSFFIVIKEKNLTIESGPWYESK